MKGGEGGENRVSKERSWRKNGVGMAPLYRGPVGHAPRDVPNCRLFPCKSHYGIPPFPPSYFVGPSAPSQLV